MEIWERPVASTCDFCLTDSDSSPLVKTYTVQHRTVIKLDTDKFWRDTGEWMACAECTRLIDAGRWNQLIQRCVTGHFQANPDMQEIPENPVTRAMIAYRLRNIFSSVFGEEVA